MFSIQVAKMKQYAKDALNRHGVAKYVIEDKAVFDQRTDEMYIRVKPLDLDDDELVSRLSRDTFSHSGKSYPRHYPCAPAKSPRAVIVNHHPTFMSASAKTIDRILARVSRPTHSQMLRSVADPREYSPRSSRSSSHRGKRQSRLPRVNMDSPRLATPSPVPWREPNKVRFRSAMSYI